MIGDSTLRRLSAGCEVVTCGVEEHVMVSEATLWRAGQCVWRVSHDGAQGVENLHVEGELPPAFASIRDRLFCEQQAPASSQFPADYIFDIPVELAKSLTGYRHDEDTPGLAANSFDVLEHRGPFSLVKSLFCRFFRP